MIFNPSTPLKGGVHGELNLEKREKDMKFSIMYLAGKINGNVDGYRQLPSTVLSEETQAKVIEEITIHLEGNEFKKHMSKVLGDNK
tara:strand:- start:308 stop:565 length:258 start_codon:yes stop_codon:yes gene_type:complete